ncbi:MAG: GTP-binding protein, partial [Angustibacter sp.]
MIKPITLITGVHPEAMAATTLSLLLELPSPVAIRHRIDLDRAALIRLVSDISGIIEHQEIDLSEGCIACAIRDDLLLSLRRLVRDQRWHSLIAQLPAGAPAAAVCAAIQ